MEYSLGGAAGLSNRVFTTAKPRTDSKSTPDSTEFSRKHAEFKASNGATTSGGVCMGEGLVKVTITEWRAFMERAFRDADYGKVRPNDDEYDSQEEPSSEEEDGYNR